ncbi:MAG: efflux RND transporter permease subunit, partial [Candidatus Latescibacteria bacterium]|nr:efflux RND transporter permease subunit [Candidatus Latescibacterota bacterium]
MADRSSILPRISVTRPVAVTMCLVALLVVGLVAYSRIQLQAFPSGWEWKHLWVWVDWPNASPQEKDQKICRLFMEYLGTVKDLRRIRTWAGRWTDASLSFRAEADMSLVYNQVMDRVERMKLELPEEARDNVGVWKFNEETDQSIMWMGVAIPKEVKERHRFMERRVQTRLERIDGVAKVSFWGAYQKKFMIEVDQEKLRTRNVSPYQMVRSLQQDNFAIAGGQIYEGGKKLYVRSLARYASQEELEDIPIQRVGGYQVRLRDVARVVYGTPPRHWAFRIDQKDAVGLDVYRESGRNIVEVCDRVTKTLDRVAKETGAEFRVFWNQGRLVKKSIGNLRNTALWGGLFAALVLLYFLRTIRMTAIITLAITLCVTITMTALYFVDWSLNVLTMMGLMVGVGMVVDNAIVIVENIFRLRGQGRSPHEASIAGASEVSLAISMATLTTVVVFLPLMLMTGREGGMSFELTRIGFPVIVALLASLFVALVFIPLAAKAFGGTRFQADPKLIRKARSAYRRGLRWTVGHRKDGALIVLLVFATIYIPFMSVKQTGRRAREGDSFYLRVYTPPNMQLPEIRSLAMELEEFIESKRELYNLETIRLNYWPSGCYIRVFLKEESNQEWWYQFYKRMRKKAGYPVDKWLDRAEAIKDLKKTIPKYVGIKIAIETRRGGGDPGVSVYLYGDDLDVLQPLAQEAVRRLQEIPSVISVDSDWERADSEVQVIIDREQARKYGISTRTVGRTIGFQLRGTNLPRYQAGDREVEVTLQLQEEDRKTLTQLKNFTFKSEGGEEVPLSAFASFKVTQGTGTIRREDGKMRLWVRAYTVKKDLEGLYEEIDRAMTGFSMPRGYTWNKGESYQKFREETQSMWIAIAMATTCVFLLMGVLFESFVLPLAVILSIPFAFLGVYWTLYLTDTVLGPMA